MDILQLNYLAGQEFCKSSGRMSVFKDRWLLKKLHQYVETISRKGRVELSKGKNNYEDGCYMHVKVCREHNKCWLETRMVGEGKRPEYINISVGLREESQVIVVKAIGMILEYRTRAIFRAPRAKSSRTGKRLSRAVDGKMGRNNDARRGEGCITGDQGKINPKSLSGTKREGCIIWTRGI